MTEMVAAEPGAQRFVLPEPLGPYTMAIVIDLPEPERIT